MQFLAANSGQSDQKNIEFNKEITNDYNLFPRTPKLEIEVEMEWESEKARIEETESGKVKGIPDGRFWSVWWERKNARKPKSGNSLILAVL